jgi:hypothetical protein
MVAISPSLDISSEQEQRVYTEHEISEGVSQNAKNCITSYFESIRINNDHKQIVKRKEKATEDDRWLPYLCH